MSLDPTSFHWIVPPRAGRPFVAAERPTAVDGDRWLAVGLDRRHLVAWRAAGQDLTRIALPADVGEVRALVLGADRVAALCDDGAWLHVGGAWSRHACERPRHGAFGSDGALYLLSALTMRCVEADGALRWSHPCDFEQPLVALGDEVWLVDWAVTIIADAEGNLREVDNGAEAAVAGAVRVGDAVVALTHDSSEGTRALLVMRGGEEESVGLDDAWASTSLSGAGDRGVLLGADYYPLDGGPKVSHRSATAEGASYDALTSDGTTLWALRGGAISTWALGEPDERAAGGLARALSWDVASDGRLALVVPNALVLVDADGAQRARVDIPGVWQARFSRDGARVVVIGPEATPPVRTLDAATGALLCAHAGPIARPQCVAVLPDDTVAVSEGFTLHLLDADLAPYGRCDARPNDYATAMDQLVADGPWLVGLDTQRTLHVFRVPQTRAERKAVAPAHTVSRNRFSGRAVTIDGDTLVACGDASQRWSLVTGDELDGPALPGPVVAGRGRAIVWADGAVHALDGGATWPCPARPDGLVGAGGHVFVEIGEGIARL